MAQWTTTTLAESVRRIAQLPDAGSPTDQEILNAAHALILTRFEPAIRAIRDNYMLRYEDIDLVASQASYRIPARSQADTIRDVLIVDSSGRTSAMQRLTTQRWVNLDPTATGTPAAFIVIGNKIHVHPKPQDATSDLRVYYYRRASKLVPVSECYPVASKTSTTIVVTGTPAWTSGVAVDVVEGTPGFDLLVEGSPARASSTFTYAGGEDLSEVAAADYVCLYDETCFPGIPAEMHRALEYATAAQMLVEEADAQNFGMVSSQADRALADAIGMMSPRVEGRSVGIINRSSPLRSGRSRRNVWGL